MCVNENRGNRKVEEGAKGKGNESWDEIKGRMGSEDLNKENLFMGFMIDVNWKNFRKQKESKLYFST